MEAIFMANEGRPNCVIVALEYTDTPHEAHAFALTSLVDIKKGTEVC
jgi:hypothetical protein